MADDEVTHIALRFAFSTCSERDGDHVHLSIIGIPAGLAVQMVPHLTPIINAAVVEFFVGLAAEQPADRSKMQ